METIKVTNLQIEDYYGITLDNLIFENKIEINPKEFDLRVEGFSFVEQELEEEGGYLIRIQCEHEQSLNGWEEIDLIHSQIMEIILEGGEGLLDNEQELSDQLTSCLEMLIQ
jgi:hypothetical protein